MQKMAIFEILANIETMLRGEDAEVAKKPEDMWKRIVSASLKS